MNIYIWIPYVYVERINQYYSLFFVKMEDGPQTNVGQMIDKAKWFQRIAKGLPGLWSNTYQTCVSQRHLLLLSGSFRHVFRHYFESPGTEQETMKHQPSKTIEDICCRLLQQLNQPQNIKLKKKTETLRFVGDSQGWKTNVSRTVFCSRCGIVILDLGLIWPYQPSAWIIVVHQLELGEILG